MKIVAELMSKGAKALLIAGLSLTVVSFYIPHTAVLYGWPGGVFGMMAANAALSLRLSGLQIVAGVIAMASCFVAGLCYFWNARVGRYSFVRGGRVVCGCCVDGLGTTPGTAGKRLRMPTTALPQQLGLQLRPQRT
jgi:hypothetical protein